MLRSVVLSFVCAFALAACAGGPGATGVGATSQIAPKVTTAKTKKKPAPKVFAQKTRAPKKRVRVAGSSCRGLNRELRRLENKGQTATAAYDSLISRYVDKNC